MILQPSHASQIPDNEVGMYRSVMKDLFVQVRQLFQNLDSRFEYGSVEDKVGSALTVVMAHSMTICRFANIFRSASSFTRLE